ncbi:MAG: hypothetical protein DRG09_02900 [Epsilonproteobacteria bacterium]|nr:MAG: hypothetical protein DRG09_02900 [Campylobacterota bacterium]
MGLKFLLTIMIALIISTSLFMELSNKLKQRKAFSKDLEFTHTTFIEVDTQKMQGWAFGTYGVRDKGVLTLDNIVFHTDNIDSLIAKKGKYIKEVLYLDGDVVMQEKGGYTYNTQHANYNQKTEILNITAPFTGVRGQNVMKGKSLRYDTVKKEAFGTGVDAVVYTTEK